MSDFSNWFAAAKAEAEATETGKAFLAAGFEFHTTGGGCTAWRLELADGREVLATDLSGTSHEVHGEWLLGVYRPEDGDEGEGYQFAADDLVSLLAKAEGLKAT